MGENLLIIAGEPSGDALGAPLVKGIRESRPNIDLWGYGGVRMRDAGVEILTPVSELAFMGFRDVVGRLPEMFRRMDNLADEAKKRKTNGAVLIDYPGFNIRLADRLAKCGIPVVYYVSPQIWAWKPGRIKKLARSISRMLTILPFEKEIYEKHGVPVTYVGHYFVDEVVPTIEPSLFRERLGLHNPLLLMLPGSRRQEVSRLIDVMLSAFDILETRIDGLYGLIPKAPELDLPLFDNIDRPNLRVIEGNAVNAMFASTAALCCSGSATLQCALAGLPHVITYRTDAISAAIYRSMIRTKFIGLSNLVAGRELSRELIQRDATPQNLADAIEPFLTNEIVRKSKIAELESIGGLLGEHGASERAAIAVVAEIFGSR